MNQMEKAKAQLLLDVPFYGYQLLSLPLIIDNTIKTACTNGKCIKYNENFVNTLSLKQKKTLLIHEAKHVMYMHHFRVKGFDFELFNEAGDYAINSETVWDEGFEMIPNMLLEYKYKNMSTEQIYKLLQKDPEQQKKAKEQRSKEGGTGDVEKAPPEIKESEEKGNMKERIAEAQRYAEKAGKMPENLNKKITKYLNPKVAWEKLLLNWFCEKSIDDFNWSARDYRILDHFFPALEDDELGKIGIAIDVSGSINQKLYNQFISEINKIRKGFSFDGIILTCNTRVTSEMLVSKYQVIKFNVKGGGGTRFKPVFDRFKKENLAGIIYFTDMESPDLYNISRPSCGTLWVNFGNRDIKAPFGRVIKIKE